jgi:molecular chaperone GrpE
LNNTFDFVIHSYMHDDEDLTIEQDGREEAGGSEDDLEASESQAGNKVAKVKKELEQVKKEKQEYLDGWQRAKADYVNALKRFDEEKRGAVELGVMKAARAFIPAMDSLARAEGAGEIPDTFQGIAKQLHDAAKSLGLMQFGAIGDIFDPMQHEALGQDPTDDASKDDTVTAVLEPGWKAGELVVRPAKVRVASHT